MPHEAPRRAGPPSALGAPSRPRPTATLIHAPSPTPGPRPPAEAAKEAAPSKAAKSPAKPRPKSKSKKRSHKAGGGKSAQGKGKRPEPSFLGLMQKVKTHKGEDGRRLAAAFERLPSRAKHPEYYELARSQWADDAAASITFNSTLDVEKVGPALLRALP